ncbi:MAG TPA: hypothetical protein VK459_19660, partial [Polyangiaceae bacterium]|nr:hypothetical protein [Polyangiaceae bacterium]
MTTTTTTKKPKTGGEIDAYCTKCRLDLLHRIIAMVGDSVKKVECKTCGSHHLYRRPKSERDERLRMLESKRASGDAKPAREGRTTAAERLTAAQK